MGSPLGRVSSRMSEVWAPSRELSNHQLSHDSILQLMMIFPEMIDASLTFPCARTSCTINYPTRLDLIFFIYNIAFRFLNFYDSKHLRGGTRA